MKGHIAKKGKAYYCVIDEGADANGKRRQRWHKAGAKKKDAETRLAELLVELHKGTYTAPIKTTAAAYLRSWLEAHRVNKPLRDSTYHGYQKIIEKLVIPRIGPKLTLQQLDATKLDKLYAELLSSGRRDGTALNPRTVRHTAMVLHGALESAVKKGILPVNPADRADAPKATKADTHTWTPGELRRFLESVRDDRLYAAWLLSASTGLRRGELLGLRWRDCDFEAGTVQITQALLDVGHKVTFGKPKSDSGYRTVALDGATVSALREHRKGQLEERLALGSWPDHDLVFTRADGEPVHPAWFSRAFDQRVKRTGLPALRLHDLRHTHATIALAAGIHPKIVSERLGHSKIAITLDTYSHAIPALDQKAAEEIAALVSGAV